MNGFWEFSYISLQKKSLENTVFGRAGSNFEVMHLYMIYTVVPRIIYCFGNFHYFVWLHGWMMSQSIRPENSTKYCVWLIVGGAYAHNVSQNVLFRLRWEGLLEMKKFTNINGLRKPNFSHEKQLLRMVSSSNTSNFWTGWAFDYNKYLWV